MTSVWCIPSKGKEEHCNLKYYQQQGCCGEKVPRGAWSAIRRWCFTKMSGNLLLVLIILVMIMLVMIMLVMIVLVLIKGCHLFYQTPRWTLMALNASDHHNLWSKINSTPPSPLFVIFYNWSPGEGLCALYCHRRLPLYNLGLRNLLLLLLLLWQVGFQNTPNIFSVWLVPFLRCSNTLSGGKKKLDCKGEAQMTTFQKVNFLQFLFKLLGTIMGIKTVIREGVKK